MHSIRKSVKKLIDNICNNSEWAWYSEMNIISSVLAPKTYKYTLSDQILDTWWQLADIWARQTKTFYIHMLPVLLKR